MRTTNPLDKFSLDRLRRGVADMEYRLDRLIRDPLPRKHEIQGLKAMRNNYLKRIAEMESKSG